MPKLYLFALNEPAFVQLGSNSGEQQLFLFNWLSKTERRIKASDKDALQGVTTDLSSTFLKLLSTTNVSFPGNYLAPPIYRQIARCFVLLFRMGEDKSLFDAAATLMHDLAQGKEISNQGDRRIAGVHILGILCLEFPQKLASLLYEVIAAMFKLLRPPSGELLRYEALLCIRNVIRAGGKELAESAVTVKDLVKAVKGLLGEKASLRIKQTTAEILEAVIRNCPPSVIAVIAPDLETLPQHIVKNMEGCTLPVRSALSRLLAIALVVCLPFVPKWAHAKGITKMMRKSATVSPSQSQASADGPPPPSRQNTFRNAEWEINMEGAIYVLSSLYQKNEDRECRIGLIYAIGEVFYHVHNPQVEAFYQRALQALLWGWFLPAKHQGISWMEMNALREQCAFILRDVLGTILLDEDQRVMASRDLIRSCLTQWPAVLPGAQQIDPDILVCSLQELSVLIIELGGVTSSLQDDLKDPLLTLLEHPNHSVRVACAWCLRSLCYSVPSLLAGIFDRLFETFQMELMTLGQGVLHQYDILNRLVGYSYGVVALLGVVPDQPMYLSMEVATGLLNLCLQFLTGHQRNLLALLREEQAVNSSKSTRTSLAQMKVVWTLMGGLMKLGPNFVASCLQDLLQVWSLVFPDVSTVVNSNAPTTQREWLLILFVQECALSTMCSFIDHNKALLNDDIVGKMDKVMNNVFGWMTYRSSHSQKLPWQRNFGGSNKEPDHDSMFGRGSNSITAHITGEGFVYSNTLSQSSKHKSKHEVESPICPYFSASVPEVEALWLSRIFDLFAGLSGFPTFEALHGSLIKHVCDVLLLERQGIADRLYEDNDKMQFPQRNDATGTGLGAWSCADLPVTGVLRSKAWNPGSIQSFGRWIECQVHHPHSSAIAHDYGTLFLALSTASPNHTANYISGLSLPSPVQVVDSAIRLFGRIFSAQTASVQEQIVQDFYHLVEVSPSIAARTNQKPKPKKRKLTAASINAIVALLQAVTVVDDSRDEKSTMSDRMGFKSLKVMTLCFKFARVILGSEDPMLRDIAAEVIGRISPYTPTSARTQFVSNLTEAIASQSSMHLRCGAAQAIASVHAFVGGLASEGHFRTAFSILQSLALEPVAEFKAIAVLSLCRIIDASQVTLFKPHLQATTFLMLKLAMDDSVRLLTPTDCAISSLGPVWDLDQIVARLVCSVIRSLGPELMVEEKTKNLCIDLIEHFMYGSSVYVTEDTLECLQHVLLLLPSEFDMRTIAIYAWRFIKERRNHPTHSLVKMKALKLLHQVMQRGATEVLDALPSIGKFSPGFIPVHGIEVVIMRILETERQILGAQSEVQALLWQCAEHSGSFRPSTWIGLCRGVLTNTLAHQEASTAAKGAKISIGEEGGFGSDEEEQGLAGTTQDRGGQLSREDLSGSHNVSAFTTASDIFTGMNLMNEVQYPGIDCRKGMGWQNQLLALKALRHVLKAILNLPQDELAIHTDLYAARQAAKMSQSRKGKTRRGFTGDFLVSKLGDLIRLAFTAATSPSILLRLEGLSLLEDVLNLFSRTMDPDFEGIHLLEQYQAQLTSALTPAFSLDSAAEVKSRACNVCAQYAVSGITDDVQSLNRVLKLLREALNQFVRKGSTSYEATNSHSTLIVKMAVINAWAELALAQTSYLKPILDETLGDLVEVWLQTLHDFQQCRYGLSWRKLSMLRWRSGDRYNPFSRAENGLGSLQTPQIHESLRKQATLPVYLKHFGKILLATCKFLDNNRDMTDTSLLFGLAIDPLCGSPEDEETIISCLEALLAMLANGTALPFWQDAKVLVELCYCFKRLLWTQHQEFHRLILAIIAQVAQKTQGSWSMSDKSAQALLRLNFMCLAFYVPRLAEQTPFSQSSQTSGLKSRGSHLSGASYTNVNILRMAVTNIMELAQIFRENNSRKLDSLLLLILTGMLSSTEVAPEIILSVLEPAKMFAVKSAHSSQIQVVLAVTTTLASIITQESAASPDGKASENVKSRALSMTFFASAYPEIFDNSKLLERVLAALKALLKTANLGRVAMHCLRSICKALAKAKCKSALWQIYRSSLPDILPLLVEAKLTDEIMRYLGDSAQALEGPWRTFASNVAVGFAVRLLLAENREVVSIARSQILDLTCNTGEQGSETSLAVHSLRLAMKLLPTEQLSLVKSSLQT